MYIFEWVVAGTFIMVFGGGGIAAFIAGAIEDHQNIAWAKARKAQQGDRQED